jgi:hypothetical protein
MGAIMGNNLKAVKLAYTAMEAIGKLQRLESDMDMTGMTAEDKNATFELYKDLDRLTCWYEERLSPEEWKELRSSK